MNNVLFQHDYFSVVVTEEDMYYYELGVNSEYDLYHYGKVVFVHKSAPWLHREYTLNRKESPSYFTGYNDGYNSGYEEFPELDGESWYQPERAKDKHEYDRGFEAGSINGNLDL